MNGSTTHLNGTRLNGAAATHVNGGGRETAHRAPLPSIEVDEFLDGVEAVARDLRVLAVALYSDRLTLNDQDIQDAIFAAENRLRRAIEVAEAESRKARNDQASRTNGAAT